LDLILDNNIKEISGGELQRVAIAAMVDGNIIQNRLMQKSKYV